MTHTHLDIHGGHRVKLAESIQANLRQALPASEVRQLDHRPRRVVEARQQSGVHIGKVGRDDAENLFRKPKFSQANDARMGGMVSRPRLSHIELVVWNNIWRHCNTAPLRRQLQYSCLELALCRLGL